MKSYYLTLSCADRPGIVAAVSGLLFRCGGNILESQQFDDLETGRFFMRIVFGVAAADAEMAFRSQFEALASDYGMTWSIRATAEKRRVLMMVSKLDHCLDDLLYRHRIGELSMEVAGIVSNHPREVHNEALIESFPYHCLPITQGNKAEQEIALKRIIDESRAELIVLARYMQILSNEMASYLTGRCINIHHSFLPAFKGARPYHQAHARGVKLIGATAHYVTGDLDEGPIISQDVEHVTHAESVEELVRRGRDIERRVLARAVRWHLQDRILVNGVKTVVFAS